MKPSRRSLLVIAALACAAALVHGMWIPAKAQAAQWLIARSWNVAAAGGSAPPPWPWADTRPVAVLEAPAHGVRLFVLEGSSGRNLAFGPVFANGSEPGSDMVISGHRDTHFRFMTELQAGDLLRITGPDGDGVYEVVQTDVVDSRDTNLLIDPGVDRLSLVTCWPFDAVATGGPMRYVVTALPVARQGS